MLRFLLWRTVGLLASLIGVAVAGWLLGGGLGRELRGHRPRQSLTSVVSDVARPLAHLTSPWRTWAPVTGGPPLAFLAPALAGLLVALIFAIRWHSRSTRRYVRHELEVYRGDHTEADSLVTMFESLHRRLARRWWRRMLFGQPSLALEVHHAMPAGRSVSSLAVSAPLGAEEMVQAALRGAYPNCRLSATVVALGSPPAVLRLKKSASFIARARSLERFEREAEPPMNRLLTAMGAAGAPAYVQLALTPAPALFERLARHAHKRHEAQLARRRSEGASLRERSTIEDAELRAGLELQHRPLFFLDLRVVAPNRRTCELIASELRVGAAENRLVERGTALRHSLLGGYSRRVQRGEGNPLPSFDRSVFATTELATIWQLPSVDFLAVPFARGGLPNAPAPPGIARPADQGTLRDAFGPVSIEVSMRKQNTAVPGTVEQGKSSYLVASVAEDLQRDRCAVIVLDPKGDAADAALSVVPDQRTCTLLDFAHPTCGFNPLAVAAPADVIADYVVAALKNLFSDADIRASSDRYLRNAIIAVLAHDRRSTLWDAARLLTVGEEGYSYRRRVGASVRALPAFKEISAFFTAELSAQLADSRATTTAKLDAPVNKLARLLNSPSTKRVLLNDSLRVDFDRVIAGGEVLIVRGALGAMGAGNTSVLMQLLVGMLDAALARQQDLVAAHQRVAVALKIDEAPLILNRGFAETMALKRSAGLETVACWQTDSQWVDRDVRQQLDALFAHRVYFATASIDDARAAVPLTMAEYSDSVRPGVGRLSSVGHPDLRLHLPKFHAIASWSTQAGRQPAFIAQTIPMRVDRERLARHAARQHERGARHLSDLRQPHWEHTSNASEPPRPEIPRAARSSSSSSSPPAVVPGALPSPSEPASTPPGRVPVGRMQQPRGSASGVVAASYAELVDLDRAQSVRLARHSAAQRLLDPDPLDLRVLALVAALGHVLSSQIHRHINSGRAASTTQRRLKRLADAGMLERFQFHRSDGAGTPMCCALTPAGIAALQQHELLPEGLLGGDRQGPVPGQPRRQAPDSRALTAARDDAHLAGWMLALAHSLPVEVVLRGSAHSVVEPPPQEAGGARRALRLADLRFPGGRTPHDFMRTDGDGRRSELDRFDTVRPQGSLTIPRFAEELGAPRPALDLLLERDDRLPVGRSAAKLERYDHFLTGWAAHTQRYGRRLRAEARVVFICRDRRRARDCARHADGLLVACRAYAGEYPFDWEYTGRASVIFVAERDIHEGNLAGYGVPRLPPEVRVAAAHGDPAAGEHTAEPCELLDAATIASPGTDG